MMTYQIQDYSWRRNRPACRAHPIRTLAVGLCGAALVACSDLGSPLPAGTQDPATLRTEDGALALYRGVVLDFESGANSAVSQGLFYSALIDAGVLSDEFESPILGGPSLYYNGIGGRDVEILSVDARQLTEYGNSSTQLSASMSYEPLQKIRGAASIAIGALNQYAPNASPALRGHAYAIAGYAELLLADLFCSGVPLSTLNFERDYTYRAGSTTAEIYQHALALFDTAESLSSDSARIQNLARVGRGRALLNLGRYVEAKAAVRDIPNGFAYRFAVDFGSTSLLAMSRQMSVADGVGRNGLPYRSSNDPRTKSVSNGNNTFGRPRYFPEKYAAMGISLVTIADGIEARLTEAEADLASGSASWITTLNALRTDGTYTTSPNPIDPSLTDTTWNAGIGGVQGLRPIVAPSSDSAKVTVLFMERAAWLFATAHRQGDLRRLVRQYQRPQETVYPTGAYGPLFDLYGTDVNFPVPATERLNPRFTGCFDREA